MSEKEQEKDANTYCHTTFTKCNIRVAYWLHLTIIAAKKSQWAFLGSGCQSEILLGEILSCRTTALFWSKTVGLQQMVILVTWKKTNGNL